MGINYFNTKTFTDGLRKSHRSGGPAVRAAKKAQQILGAIVSNSANPFKGFKETNFGENRIKNCKKYALDQNYRLVTQQYKDLCFLLFIGNHAETDKWLDANRGLTQVVDSTTKEIGITNISSKNSEEKFILTNREANFSEGKIWDKLPNELELVSDGLGINRIRNLTNIEIGETAEFIWKEIEKIFPSLGDEQEELFERLSTLGDMLVSLNAGDENSAKNRFGIFNKAFLKIEDIAPKLIPDIKNNDNIYNLSEASNQYLDDIKKYIESPEPLDWLTFTHPEQEKFISSNYQSSVKLSGVSGSGKTSVLIKRACRLLKENKNARVLIVTLNKSLARLIYDIITFLTTDEERDRLNVHFFFELCANYLGQFDPKNAKSYVDITTLDEHQEEIFREYYRCELNNNDALVMLDLHKKLLNQQILSESYIQQEFNWLRSFLTKNNYKKYLNTEIIKRIGRKIPFNEKDREQVVKGIQGWEKKMVDVGVSDTPRITHRILDFEDSLEPEFDHTLVDETQDFGTLELSILRKITKKGDNDLFLVGDLAQTVLPKYLKLEDAGIEIEKTKNFKLRLNYRNTKEILKASYEIMVENIDEAFIDDSDLEILDPIYANRTGEKPYLLFAENLQGEISAAYNFAKQVANEKGQNYKICIVICGYTNYEISLYSKILNIKPLDGSTVFSQNNIFLSDLEQTKGFEFNDVIIVNCNEGILPSKDLPEEESFRLGCQLYVAMTRAKDRLFLSYSSQYSKWFIKIDSFINHANWDDFIDFNQIQILDLPEKLREVIDDDYTGDNAIFALKGRNFLYTKYAVGVETRLLNFLEKNVIGKMEFSKVSKKSVRTSWENIGQLHMDLERNHFQDMKITPFYFSEKGDAELEKIFENIKVSKNRRQSETKNTSSSFKLKIKEKANLKSPKNEIVNQAKMLSIEVLELDKKILAILKKNNIKTVGQALRKKSSSYLKDPSINFRDLDKIKGLLGKAKERVKNNKKIERALSKPKKGFNASLNDQEKKFAYCYDKFGDSLDYQSYQKILGLSKKQQDKVIKLYSEFSVIDLSIVYEIPDDLLELEKVETKKRFYIKQKLADKLLVKNNPSNNKLPYDHDFTEK